MFLACLMAVTFVCITAKYAPGMYPLQQVSGKNLVITGILCETDIELVSSYFCLERQLRCILRLVIQ